MTTPNFNLKKCRIEHFTILGWSVNAINTSQFPSTASSICALYIKSTYARYRSNYSTDWYPLLITQKMTTSDRWAWLKPVRRGPLGFQVACDILCKRTRGPQRRQTENLGCPDGSSLAHRGGHSSALLSRLSAHRQTLSPRADGIATKSVSASK